MKASQRDCVSNEIASAADETLRLIATLPAPDGLVDRVQAGLRTAPFPARVLHWPAALAPMGGWMQSAAFRGAAAAAIVCVVAGGGWRVYSHIPVTPTARVIVMPARIGGGFSSAGAMRTPDPLTGPVVLTHMVTPTAGSPKTANQSLPATAHGARRGRRSKASAVAAPAQ